eukprot:CAMPEP_0114627150 /NCGR_PEP_ID=MMETSP0168-20121206/12150_1 /TAXON_ID=95228 ORGANISM="Vannella sp., Strain DIVA3 517/6/12" /NCGR_SAMPLE_ID=MMETSP0168 /ASSEMBLY_ACC=CAM_ASM_000044 /LENGTH=60 /DNA_ID=CAMNT_0001838479 /DNA_START=355 /DNA_END=534 /DNA_ORIENTATION=+
MKQKGTTTPSASEMCATSWNARWKSNQREVGPSPERLVMGNARTHLHCRPYLATRRLMGV